MSDISVTLDEIKVKFQQLQSKTQELKELKVGYEAQLGTLQSQYDDLLKTLLDETGTTSLEDAVKVCEDKKAELNTLKEELSSELDRYLSTINSSDSVNSAATPTLEGFLS